MILKEECGGDIFVAWSCCVAQTGFKPASVSQVWRLQMCTTTAGVLGFCCCDKGTTTKSNLGRERFIWFVCLTTVHHWGKPR